MSTRRIVNIINFIRYDEPRVPALDLFEPVREQMRLLKAHGLTCTWLLQFDALVAGPYVDFLKAEMPPTHEVGLWFEINRMHCEAAGIPFRGRPGLNWDYHSRAALSIGYTPAEREKLADVAVARFTALMGHAPRSVAAWYIDAHTLAYLAERHGIVASANCKEQYGTDGYTVWGGLWSGGYYPSRRNALCPAQTQAAQIRLPVFRMLGADPIYQYDLHLGQASQGVVSLEPSYTESGRSLSWVQRYLDIIEQAPCLALAYAQAGQENSFGWAAMGAGLKMQFAEIARRRQAGRLEAECLGDTGAWFAAQHATTPAQAQVALTDTFGSERRTVWYHSRYYRANLLMHGNALSLRDVHIFDEGYAEPYLRDTCPGAAMRVDTLPVLDGYCWSNAEHRARGVWSAVLADGHTERLSIAGPATVEEPTAHDLRVIVPVQPVGALVFEFGERGLVTHLRDSPQALALQLDLELPNGTAETELALQDGVLVLQHHGHRYTVRTDGALARWPGRVVCRGAVSGLTLDLGGSAR
ncbi:MAG: hypothetical protein GX557_08175 [Chloroflexi bacterium]|nr:hypothetical protein [Chloroflexota bacterium]